MTDAAPVTQATIPSLACQEELALPPDRRYTAQCQRWAMHKGAHQVKTVLGTFVWEHQQNFQNGETRTISARYPQGSHLHE